MVASEVREPQRNLPLALIVGSSAVIVIYLLGQSRVFLGASRRRRLRSSAPCGGRDDAACAGHAGGKCGQYRGHDLDFRRAQWIHSFRLARAVCHGARWAVLSTRRLRSSRASNSQRLHPGPQRLGGFSGAERPLRRSYIRTLYSPASSFTGWLQPPSSYCAIKRPDMPTAISNVGISVRPHRFRTGYYLPGGFHLAKVAAGVADGPGVGFAGIAVLFLLEKAAARPDSGLQESLRRVRYHNFLVLIPEQNT